MSAAESFLLLNREGRWADFTLRGVAVGADGAVRLASRPILRARHVARPAVDPDGPGGIAVTAQGTVYYTDTTGHRLMRVETCDPTWTPARAIGGEGSRPGRFIEPRGLFVQAARRRLLVADSGNHRIQVFDIRSLQYLGSWTGTSGHADGRETDRAGFNEPWSIAGDAEGNLYVAEHGARRVQKLDPSGMVQPDFWSTLGAAVFLADPTAVAAAETEEPIEVYILDAGARRIVVVDAHGRHVRSFTLETEAAEEQASPVGLALGPGVVHVGDAAHRIYTYTRHGEFVGPAIGFDAPVAALAVALEDVLLVHAGGGDAPVRLEQHGGYGRSGFLWGGPFRNISTASDPLHRLSLVMDPLEPGAHVRVHVYSAQRSAVAPPIGGDDRPFDLPWIPQPLDATHCLVRGAPLDSMWVAIELSGEGLTSPRIDQVRLDFDHRSYTGYLPPVYADTPEARQFVTRLLSVFESGFDEIEAAITRLPELYDPQATRPAFLSWLAGWLALDLVEGWPEERKRSAIATAFELFRARGTPAGLRRALKFFAGVDARIDEPIRRADIWMLGDDAGGESAGGSLLGFTTMLASAEPLGAVLGSTAILDQSGLIAGDEFGSPLFDDVAHKFSVQIYRGCAYNPARSGEVRGVIDREKPAHTDYHLCVVEPRMRVGFQATLGVDAIVGGTGGPVPLDGHDPSVAGLALGGGPAASLGVSSSLGRGAHVGGEAES